MHHGRSTHLPSVLRQLRLFFFFNDTATTEIYTLSLHDALPILLRHRARPSSTSKWTSSLKLRTRASFKERSEEHTSELQSLAYLVCRLLLEKKKRTRQRRMARTTPRIST